MLAALSATAAASDPNRLAGESSPYLRRHARDPVAWHPWGTEAFDLAAEQQKPVFLSIGFSTCHWCHVMERESFQDPDTAAFLNEHFICIKVDRDERPDVDQVYMTFVQATTGKGGWPLTVWLTPDREPFAGGTYFAAEDRPGRPGFRTVLEQVARAWDTDRESLLASSKNTTAALRTLTSPPEPTATAPDDRDTWNRAFSAVEAEFDPRHGGFGGPAKFPRPATLDFLFATRLLDPDEDHRQQAETMALATLRAMAAGAIRDQLGGGLHRYTVDPAWREPHFELLLTDQAQVALAYLTAFQVTGDDSFATIARGLLDAALRDMAAPGGGFHAAIDADSLPTAGASEPVEGAFYRWTRSEIEELLGTDQARLFCHRYGPDAVGPAAGVLAERHTLPETAAAKGLTEADAAARLADARSLLRAARGRRPRPEVDATLIASANGLMISALARGHQLLGDPAYLEAADAAANRILRDLVDHDGSLGHARHGDAPPGPGFADDYAFLIQGLLDLYEASFDPQRLEQAVALQQRQDAVFLDDAAGGYFASPADDPLLIVRPKPDRDEAVPSANAVSLANLRRLATIRDEPALREQAERLLAALRGRLEQTPTAALRLLVESRRLTTPATHVVIAGRRDAPDTAALVEAVWRCPATNRVLLLADGDERLGQLSPLVRLIPQAGAAAADPAPEPAATAYVCTGETCHPPTTDPAVVRRLLTAAVNFTPASRAAHLPD